MTRGIAVFSAHKLWSLTTIWAELGSGLYVDETEKTGKEYAGVLSSLGHGISMGCGGDEKKLLEGVQKCSEAVEVWGKSARFLATWLECALRAEFGGLLDLDAIITEMDVKIKACTESGMRSKELLAAFSMMSFVCADMSEGVEIKDLKEKKNSLILLSVLSRWISALGNATSHFKDCVGRRGADKTPSPSKKKQKKTGGATVDCDQKLLELVRVFLSHLEKTAGESDVACEVLAKLERDIGTVLGVVVKVLLALRCRTSRGERRGNTPVHQSPVAQSPPLTRKSSEANSESTVQADCQDSDWSSSEEGES